MALTHTRYIDLPAHKGSGGFDHADVHGPSDRLYVAHTSNDAIDIIDCAHDEYRESIPGFPAVAGALVSEPDGLVFTSNRGENTVSIFRPNAELDAIKIPVGIGPNGLAYDPSRGLLIAANVGDSGIAGSHTVTIVDVAKRERIADVAVPGRTRWAIYDAAQESFFVNISSPTRIIRISAGDPTKIASEYAIPAIGPHGLDLDEASGRLLCACDAGVLVAIDAASGRIFGEVPLSGAPDVIFLNPRSARLYVAIGDPGVIDVIDIQAMRRAETVTTEQGAHTFALDRKRNKLFVFLPRSHRAQVFVDSA